METTIGVAATQLEEKYGGYEALYEKMIHGGIEKEDLVDVWNKCAGSVWAMWVSEKGLVGQAIVAAARDEPSVVPHIKWLFGQGPNPRDAYYPREERDE